MNFTEAGYADWVSKARGEPATFWNMSQDEYNMACKALKRGDYCIYASIDRNDTDRVEKFMDLIEDLGARNILRGGD